jgi:AraC-like DNA-binding protein
MNIFAHIPDTAVDVPLIQPGYGASMPNGWVHRKVAPCIIIARALVGRYEVESLGRTVVADTGEAFFAATGDPLAIAHHGDPKRRGLMRVHWLHVHCTLFGVIDLSTLLHLPRTCDRAAGRAFGRWISELLQAPPTESHAGLRHLLRRKELTLAAIDRLCGLSALREHAIHRLRHVERLADLLAYVRENLAKPMTIDDLSRVAHLSSPRLFNLFREQMGCSPMEWVKQLRLTQACHRIISTDARIGEVAAALGFASPYHFSREFHRRFGVSPVAYRKQHALPMPSTR